MFSDEQMVILAEEVLKQIIRDWATNPERWEREIDLQCELRSRLMSVFSLLGCGYISEDMTRQDKTRLTLSNARVACEPVIAGVTGANSPDVVIWDAVEGKCPPQKGIWPILWACEIKLSSKKTGALADVTKLEHLLDGYDQILKYGCAVHFQVNGDYETPFTEPDFTHHNKYGQRLKTIYAVTHTGFQRS